jgi:hypothetical protein
MILLERYNIQAARASQDSRLIVLIGVAAAQFPSTFEQHVDPVLIGIVDVQQVHELIFDVTAKGLLFNVPLNVPDSPGALIGQLNVQAMEGHERQLDLIQKLRPFRRNFGGLMGPDVFDQSNIVHGWAFSGVSGDGSLSLRAKARASRNAYTLLDGRVIGEGARDIAAAEPQVCKACGASLTTNGGGDEGFESV